MGRKRMRDKGHGHIVRQTNYESVLILITWDCHRDDHYCNKRDIGGGVI